MKFRNSFFSGFSLWDVSFFLPGFFLFPLAHFLLPPAHSFLFHTQSPADPLLLFPSSPASPLSLFFHVQPSRSHLPSFSLRPWVPPVRAVLPISISTSCRRPPLSFSLARPLKERRLCLFATSSSSLKTLSCRPRFRPRFFGFLRRSCRCRKCTIVRFLTIIAPPSTPLPMSDLPRRAPPRHPSLAGPPLRSSSSFPATASTFNLTTDEFFRHPVCVTSRPSLSSSDPLSPRHLSTAVVPYRRHLSSSSLAVVTLPLPLSSGHPIHPGVIPSSSPCQCSPLFPQGAARPPLSPCHHYPKNPRVARKLFAHHRPLPHHHPPSPSLG